MWWKIKNPNLGLFVLLVTQLVEKRGLGTRSEARPGGDAWSPDQGQHRESCPHGAASRVGPPLRCDSLQLPLPPVQCPWSWAESERAAALLSCFSQLLPGRSSDRVSVPTKELVHVQWF